MRPYIFGDYYPLTAYSRDPGAWAGWQFDRPDLGEGMVQMFRRRDSSRGSMRIRLRGLQPDAVYVLTDRDSAGKTETSGRKLVGDGLTISIAEHPDSALVTYKRSR